MNTEVCTICGDKYTKSDLKIIYHVKYKPEITTYACQGCNYAEYLIRHPEVKTTYLMERRKKLVREWTIKNRPLINLNHF
jgi:MinD superfamily P-loop ATPase